MTFYPGDKTVDLSHAKGAYSTLEIETIVNREAIASEALACIERFMFSDAWEIYSFKRFYDRLIDLIKQTLK